jgi:hypothetical protein
MSDQCVASVVDQPRTLKVLSPNGGETYQVGQPITITWSSTGYGSSSVVSLYLATQNPDGGAASTGLMNIMGLVNDGTETVTIPNTVVAGSNYLIHAEIYDPVTTLWQSDNSDATFKIQGPTTNNCSTTTPSIKVVSPNGGEVYRVGDTVTIKWDYCGGQTSTFTVDGNTSVAIMLDDENNVSTYGEQLIGTTTIGTGSYTWVIPNALGNYSSLNGGNYLIDVKTNVHSVSDIQDFSNNTFTIQGSTTTTCTATSAPYVKIVSPTDGSSYTSGQQLLVKWESCRFLPTDIGSLVIMNSNGTQYPLAINNTLNDGQELITIPTVPTNGVWDLVIKFDGAGYAASDDIHINIQNATTSTCPVSGLPKVTVLSPNGGENYVPGQQITATWKTCKIPANTQMRIDIVMYKPNGNTVTKVLKTSTPNDGTESVTLPTNVSWTQMVYGTNFKIKVRKANTLLPQDQSDNKFTIVSAAPAKVTVILSSTNPPAGTVMVNSTSATNNVEVLKFKIKAENSAVTLRKIPIQVAISSTNVADDVTNVIDSIKLMSSNNVIDSKSGTDGYEFTAGAASSFTGTLCTNTTATADDSCAFQFNNLSSPYNQIASGSTAEFSIVIDFKSQSNYAAGTMITTSFVNADVLQPTNFSVQDVNGDQLPSSQRFGSAIGNTQILRTSGLNVVMGTPAVTSVIELNGNISRVTYNIPLSATSFGGTYYVGQSTQQAAVATGTNAVAYGFNRSTSPAILSTLEGASSTIYSSDATIEGNGYRIDDGTTKHFYMTVDLLTPSVPNSSYRVSLQQVRVFTNGALTTGAMNIDLLPTSSYQTIYQLINN